MIKTPKLLSPVSYDTGLFLYCNFSKNELKGAATPLKQYFVTIIHRQYLI